MNEKLAYDFVLAILSITSVVLGIVLMIICRKKSVLIESEETAVLVPAIKLAAKTYSLTDIDAATDGFNNLRIIGKGRFRIVYVAILPSMELLVVKRIHPGLVLSNAGFGFASKIKTLSLAQHQNLVPILGFSQAPGERIIVMEFVGMTSLDFYLQENPEGATLLDWRQRLKVADGVAKGLEYLHEEMKPSIVHGCIKGSNIILDAKFGARICDYGLGFFGRKEPRGVVGYVDQEYWVEQNGASKESDVYGFGVVLLEILSGRRSEGGLLVTWALPLIKQMRLNEVLDPRLVIPSNANPLVRLAKVASACVGNSRNCRPTISQVASILNNLEF